MGMEIKRKGNRTNLDNIAEASQVCKKLIKCNYRTNCMKRCRYKKQNLKCTELCGCSGGYSWKMKWHGISIILWKWFYKKITYNSYLFCRILFILVRVFGNDYFFLLNISGSVLVIHIDIGYDHHLEGE